MVEWSLMVSAASEKAATRHLISVFGEGIQKLTQPLNKDPYHDAMVKALEGFSRIIETYLQALGYFDDDLETWLPGIKALIDDPVVADELWSPLVGEDKDNSPNVEVLQDTWTRLMAEPMPKEFKWEGVAASYRMQVERQRIIDKDLRPQLNIEELVRLRKAVQGAAPTGDVHRYAARMRTKYRILDLTNFISPTEDQPNRGMLLREAFVPQLVREDPPPVEVPRDLVQKLVEHGEWQDDALDEEIHDKVLTERTRRLQTEHMKKPLRPVLDVVAEPASSKLVVVGGPGSGKSMLTRFLLLKTLDTLDGGLPLLIELRDYHAEREADHCDDFLTYCHYLGKDQGYFLNEIWLADRLKAESSLVLFDGLDEIFDPEARRKMCEAIIGFGHRFPKARILVTTRPVGYKDVPFRNAGFRQVALEDLTQEQIEAFVQGWFGRLFDEERPAKQRIQRVLGATKRSKSIRLLAGNPMLLTIMCLIAQQRELPRDRVRFYEQAADVLCHHWDANRGLEDAGIEGSYIDLDDKHELLRKIAFRMQAADGGLAGNFIRESDLRDEITAYLERHYHKAPDEAKVASKALIAQLRNRNYVLCLRGPNLYGFVHRTILEYFCAAELVRLRGPVEGQISLDQLRDNYFAKNWKDEAWQEPLRLICGMVGEKDAEALILFLIEKANPNWSRAYQISPPRHLGLAVHCLAEHRGYQVLGRVKETVTRGVIQFFELPDFSFHSTGYHHGGLPRATRIWAESVFLPAITELAQGWADTIEVESLAVRLAFKANPQTRATYSRALAHMQPDRTVVREVFNKRATKDTNRYVRSAAVAALASTWRDDAAKTLITERVTKDLAYSVRRAAVEALASAWGDDDAKTLIMETATKEPHSDVRSAAVEALATEWGDSDAKALITELAQEDLDLSVRRAAVLALASAWRDDDAKTLITERATKDTSQFVRSAAVEALASIWRDDDAKSLIMETATKEPHRDVRSVAVKALAAAWADKDAKALITERATKDASEDVRKAAVEALASAWGDDDTKTLVTERATKDLSQNVRSAAVAALASAWEDDDAKTFITKRAIKDTNQEVRRAAVAALATTWGDDDAKTLITERAAKDPHEDVRKVAVEALTSAWRDNDAKTLIMERTTKDTEPYVRSAALLALASAWGDDDAKTLTIERATEDPHEDVRRTAVSALASAWGDKDAKILITERATKDVHQNVRKAAVSALIRRYLQEPTLTFLVSRDLDGIPPFLDPKEAAPGPHIKKAASRLGLSEEEVRAQLSGYKNLLGWDPLVGCG